ncbi:histone-lysine N-methyltransferase SETMAR [Nephila pilipes]|uniref:Histone-lysine N-methyltransferase SETMAR n=1 Tax=Nephila pilipes TaxID=299642 RepID=A0A8X6JAZ3_NEPPI|nr:histone-lysine N-methyltransferase SETMAR [Nephila pilipes]
MAQRLGKRSRIEVRAVIRFFWAKNVAATEIHRKIVEVYGDKAMCRQQVAKCSFQTGREHVENRNMEASGRPSSSRTDINTAYVEEIIKRDRRVTVCEIASELDLSYVLNHIMSENRCPELQRERGLMDKKGRKVTNEEW